jgi:repressor LexA
MDELTERQTAILTFISRHCRDSGYPPTVREIGMAVGLASPSTVHAHLAKLESAGHIRRDPTKPRAMFVCRDASRERETARPAPAPPVAALPLVGSVAAGALRLAEQEVEDWVTSPFEGDMVVVRRTQTASDGEIVVAQVEDEATVKRLRRVDGRVHLIPENPAYAPIVPEGEVTLAGVVTGVLRRI